MNLPSNLVLLYDDYLGSDDYYESYFKTDHHWNLEGTYHAYLKLIESLDMEKRFELGEKIPLESLQVLGSNSRDARMYLTESVREYPGFDHELEVLKEDGTYAAASSYAPNLIHFNKDTIIDFYTSAYSVVSRTLV